MKNLFKWSSVVVLSVALSVIAPLYAAQTSEIAKKKASCACPDKCPRAECAVHKGKDCDCS
ncbi:hypothetical protein EM20IM_04985 [Candidatus Methylacidiphilum infernorum]|uniref:Uncharacterized protein n=1 Tax=Candidatus Methylacidiphilum infernorum TaxID=511746 RepID=A0ABX7PY87_9BACT|nr:hypothetical protein [Candidatus Methylacidiphilum infernorum]QSR87674.1 hypothetical protein EM20IM_04985 [Candidatus Methylacidiphilum infernorum]